MLILRPSSACPMGWAEGILTVEFKDGNQVLGVPFLLLQGTWQCVSGLLN